MIATIVAFVSCTPSEQPGPDKSADPSEMPSADPSEEPTADPSGEPENPSEEPTADPSEEPEEPSDEPIVPGAVSIGEKQFDSIQAAVDDAQDGDVLVLNDASYKENVKIRSKQITIDGKDKAVLTGSIELTSSAAEIYALVIEPDGSMVTAETGWDSYPYGIRVNDGGHGFIIEDVVIDMSGTKTVGSGTGILYLNATGSQIDKIGGCTILGEGERLLQAYDARLALINNQFINPYRSYGIRIGGSNVDVEIVDNTFSSENDVTNAIHLNDVQGGQIVFGNGIEDDNTYDKTFKNRVDGSATNVTFRPDITLPVSNQEPAVEVSINSLWRKANYNSWFGTGSVPDVTGENGFVKDWYRNVAMDDNYIYISASSKTDSRIVVVDIKNPDNVQIMNTSGVADGTFFTNCVRTIQNGSTTAILASNLSFEGMWAGDNDTQTLKLYAWQGKDDTPTQILNFPLDDAVRLGDKFQVYGDWNDGLIFFKNYSPGDKEDIVYIFTIKNGVVDPTPVKKRLNGIPEGWAVSAVSAYYPYTATTGIMSGWNATLAYEPDGNDFKCQYWTGEYMVDPYTRYNHGVNFFTLGGQEYILWVHILDKDSEIHLYKKVGDFVETISDPANLITARLVGEESGEDVGSANGTGDAAVRVINGVAYVAVSVPGHGIGVFEIK